MESKVGMQSFVPQYGISPIYLAYAHVLERVRRFHFTSNVTTSKEADLMSVTMILFPELSRHVRGGICAALTRKT